MPRLPVSIYGYKQGFFTMRSCLRDNFASSFTEGGILHISVRESLLPPYIHVHVCMYYLCTDVVFKAEGIT